MKVDLNEAPNFLVIGAGKSGTTSLNNYLRQHPEVFMCPVKEPNFFAYHKHDRSDFNRPEDIYHYENSVTDLDEYLKLFKGSKPYKARGETSNTYLYGKYSIETILNYLGKVKLIAILRHPADRLYSRYMHLARENAIPSENFNDIFDKESIWWQRPDLVNEGFYYKHLSKFYSSFNKNHIKIFFYHDLKADNVGLTQSVFKFLEVDSSFVPTNSHIVFNKSGLVKNKLIHKLLGPKGIILSSIKRVMPRVFESFKNSDFMKHNLIKLRSSNLKKPALSPDMKRKITHEIYLEDIKQLEELIDKPLNHWYQ